MTREARLAVSVGMTRQCRGRDVRTAPSQWRAGKGKGVWWWSWKGIKYTLICPPSSFLLPLLIFSLPLPCFSNDNELDYIDATNGIMAIFLKTVHQHLRGEHKSNGYLQSSRHLVLSKKRVFFYDEPSYHRHNHVVGYLMMYARARAATAVPSLIGVAVDSMIQSLPINNALQYLGHTIWWELKYRCP